MCRRRSLERVEICAEKSLLFAFALALALALSFALALAS